MTCQKNTVYEFTDYVGDTLMVDIYELTDGSMNAVFISQNLTGTTSVNLDSGDLLHLYEVIQEALE